MNLSSSVINEAPLKALEAPQALGPPHVPLAPQLLVTLALCVEMDFMQTFLRMKSN